MKASLRNLSFALIAALLGTAAAAACTYDFHAFDPEGPGSEGGGNTDASLDHDGSTTPNDAGGDTGAPGCRADPTCLSKAIECSADADVTDNACRNKCAPLDLGCPGRCDAQRTSDKTGCRNTCYACTRNTGCEDPIKCRDAVDGTDGG